ncbi:S8 family serine peptidase [Spirosoma sp. SC4-14]|uniref:S8 family serine peptidase n=1 Tax=Spirosoma sp. SC4-14 TaxID=3128900 RepID=UPI0030D5B111
MPAKTKVDKSKVLYAHASVRSLGGTSLFDVQPEAIRSTNVNGFFANPNLVNDAVNRLKANGFDVLQVGDTTISIAAPIETYEKVFKTKIVSEDRPVIKAFAQEDEAEFFDTTDTPISGLIDTSKSNMADVLEGVAINEPVYFMANKFAPAKAYWHLTVPGDVSMGMNADRAHRANYTGRGVKALMVDSGWYRHPYFTARGYRVAPVVLGPGATAADHDESGHGTGESANLLAVAPDTDFGLVKMNFVDSVGGFNAAVALNPAIISCSWGSSKQFGPLSAADNVLAAAIANAVRQGIIVVFSAGNGHWGFPGQHPDVISAGGAFMQPDGSLQASNYASGFASNIYPGRSVPDVCGLVGMLPRAAYIMLPIEPGDEIDTGLAGGVHPAADETANNDGWAAFSGTSAAAPMLAGICALMKQAYPRMTPAEARDFLKRTAIDVTTGVNALGNAAGVGPDLATGYGLADAYRATMLARLRAIITSGGFPLPVPIIPPVAPTAVVAPVDEFPQALFGNGSVAHNDLEAIEELMIGSHMGY